MILSKDLKRELDSIALLIAMYIHWPAVLSIIQGRSVFVSGHIEVPLLGPMGSITDRYG